MKLQVSVIVGLVLLWSLPSAALAQNSKGAGSCSGSGYRELYREGVQARDFERWKDVIACMRAALREKPEAESVWMEISGQRSERYMPYFHLGWALSELGYLSDAHEALRASLEQGVVRKDRRFDDLRARLAEVEGKLARSSVGRAEELRDRLGEQMNALTVEGDLRRRLEEAQAELSRVESKIVSGDVGEALELSEHVATELEELARDVTKLGQRAVEGLLDQAEALAEAKQVVTGPGADLGTARELERWSESYERLPADPNLEDIIGLHRELVELTADLEALPEPFPSDLAAAADAYVARKYEVVLRLTPASYADPRYRLRAHLLVAAAAHARSRIAEPEARDEARRTALEHVRECLEIEPDFRPPSRLFPPDFIALFSSSREPGGT